MSLTKEGMLGGLPPTLGDKPFVFSLRIIMPLALAKHTFCEVTNARAQEGYILK
jgi:hypothetical protein